MSPAEKQLPKTSGNKKSRNQMPAAATTTGAGGHHQSQRLLQRKISDTRTSSELTISRSPEDGPYFYLKSSGNPKSILNLKLRNGAAKQLSLQELEQFAGSPDGRAAVKEFIKISGAQTELGEIS